MCSVSSFIDQPRRNRTNFARSTFALDNRRLNLSNSRLFDVVRPVRQGLFEELSECSSSLVSRSPKRTKRIDIFCIDVSVFYVGTTRLFSELISITVELITITIMKLTIITRLAEISREIRNDKDCKARSSSIHERHGDRSRFINVDRHDLRLILDPRKTTTRGNRKVSHGCCDGSRRRSR